MSDHEPEHTIGIGSIIVGTNNGYEGAEGLVLSVYLDILWPDGTVTKKAHWYPLNEDIPEHLRNHPGATP